MRVLLVLALLGACATAAKVEDRPISKIVNMLKDMNKQLAADAETDATTNDKLTCWCKENDRTTTTNIAAAQRKIEQLTSTIEELTAKSAALKKKIADTTAETQAGSAALEEARTMRVKDETAFHEEETDLIAAIKALEGAITALQSENPGLLQKSVVDGISHLMKVHKDIAYSAIGLDSFNELHDFLASASRKQSFLQQDQAPSAGSYASRSGQIFGILKQMKTTFKENLAELRKNEASSVDQYKQVKQTKEEQIAASQAMRTSARNDRAETDTNNEAAKSDLADTTAQLSEDEKFLLGLRKQCSESDAEYARRVKSRNEEMAAVQDTIKILNDDDAFDLFGKSVSFLQMGSHHTRLSELKRRAINHLREVAKTTKNPHLALMAQKLTLDAFVEVKKAIDSMMADLKQQNKDEIDHKDLCVADFAENKRQTAVADDEKSDLETKLENLGVTIKSLTEEIAQLEKENGDMKRSMSRASDDRAAENADFQQTIVDQRATQEILKKAINRMQAKFASFVQAHYTPLTGDPPAKFTKYELNAGGNKVITLLTNVLNDSRGLEKTAITDESDAQAAYEEMMKNSNEAIRTNMNSISNRSGELADANKDHAIATDDLAATNKNLERLSKILADTHGNCDFVMKNFDIRQSTRTAEINALMEAKNILSGMH